MIPLGDSTKSLIEKLRPKESDFPPVKRSLPPFEGLRERRFFLARGADHGAYTRVTIIWVDDDATCLKERGPDYWRCHTLNDAGFMEPKDWHTYTIRSEFRQENPLSLRCPLSLTPDERDRLETDDPIGRAETRAREVKAEQSHRKAASRPEPSDEDPF